MSSNRCYVIRNLPGFYVPVISNHALDESNVNITTAIIAIHGLNENVVRTYFSLLASIGRSDASDLTSSVLVIVPWFHEYGVKSEDWNPACNQILNQSMPSFAWSGNSSWIPGGDSTPVTNLSLHTHSASVASFTVLDDLYDSLTLSGNFPALRQVTFAGFSAGGQMINRYAWASKIGIPTTGHQHHKHAGKDGLYQAKEIDPDPEPVLVRFIVSDASSYVYLDNLRPATECRANYDTGVTHNCTAFTDASQAGCNQYNVWKYGTMVLPGAQDGVSYLQALSESPHTIGAAHTDHFRQKDIRYVFGAADSCNCKTAGFVNAPHCMPQSFTTAAVTPDTSFARHLRSAEQDAVNSTTANDNNSTSTTTADNGNDNDKGNNAPMCFTPSSANALLGAVTGIQSTCCDTYPDSLNNDLSTSCGANLQGSNRLQRGLNYMYYLQDYYYRQDVAAAQRVPSSIFAPAVKPIVLFQPTYQVVPDLQHDVSAFYSAPIVQEWMLQLPPAPSQPHTHPAPWVNLTTVLFSIGTLLLLVYLWGVRECMLAKEERLRQRRTLNTDRERSLNDDATEESALL